MKDRGVLIVLEGSDGSGKTTQFNLLNERLKASGYDVEVFDFPRYEKGSSYFVKRYLNGEYGPAESISPYTASLFYALDRFEAAKDIKSALDQGKIVLADRYVGANMAFQGAKFEDPVEQRGFFVWEDNLEFQLLNIPRPDTTIFLRVPAEISQTLLKQRSKVSGIPLDEHEKNVEFLKKTTSTYDLLCQLFPKDFTTIDCVQDGRLMSIPQISNLIWEKLRPILPARKPHAGHPSVVTLNSRMSKATSAPTNTKSNKLTQDFKSASLLLKLHIERQLKSVEPAGFNIWSDNGYKFYTPMGLPKDIENAYKSSLEQIGQLHRQMRQKLESYYERKLLSGTNNQPTPNISTLLLPVTPLSALCDFSAELSEKAIRRISSGLLANDSPELQWAAKQLYTAARHQWPDDFKNPLESAGGPESINNIIAKLAEDRLPLNSGASQDVRLLEVQPRQEFDLLGESIYPYSNLSLEEISEEVSGWSYQQKYESLKQAASDPSILEKIRYKFDVISDQIVMSEIINSAVVSNLQLQIPSPRYGYEVPAVLEDAGIDDLYLECFDESIKLFSLLQQTDRDDITVYAALLGHKLRWQFSADAKNMSLIFGHTGSQTYLKVINSLKEKTQEVHPLTWEVLSSNQTASSPQIRRKQNRVKPSRRRPNKPSRSS